LSTKDLNEQGEQELNLRLWFANCIISYTTLCQKNCGFEGILHHIYIGSNYTFGQGFFINLFIIVLPHPSERKWNKKSKSR